MTGMKPYLMFAGSHYYPAGGWEDFRGAFETLSEAMKAADARLTGNYPDDEWVHVVNFHVGQILASRRIPYSRTESSNWFIAGTEVSA